MYYIKKLTFYLFIYLCLSFQASASVTSPEQAGDFLKNIGDKVITILSTEKSDDKREQKLDQLFIQTVDINWIARFVAGRYWNESTEEQKEKYLQLYNKFLVGNYVPKFRQYTDQKMIINKSLSDSEGEYLIETTINDHDNKSYKVSYKVRQSGDSDPKIYDIIAEGVSMITTQRSEFGSILAREGMDALIAKLDKKR